MASRRPLARIHLDAIEHNYAEIRACVGEGVDVIAMVKADAYGHGATRVVETLFRAGCRSFGVATLDEAAGLAGGVAPGRLIVFGGILPEDAGTAVEIGAEIIAYDEDVIEALAEAGRRAGRSARVHIHADTGMHRLGAKPITAGELAVRAASLQGVEPVALCSHFADAESEDPFLTDAQLALFESVCTQVKAEGISLQRHVANSAALTGRADTHMDAVRPGLALYGLNSMPKRDSAPDLRPAMTLTAPVIRVMSVGPGEGIGYGHSFRTERATTVATVRCGYADGYPRALSNTGEVLIGEKRAPIIGRICMDHFMVDATDVPGVNAGDSVTLWGPGLAAETVAAAADTISYELVSRVGPRVARVYD